MYVADLDYDDSYVESPYDDLEPSINDSDDDEEEDYARFVDPRNAVARSRREHTSRYNYSGDPKSSFTQNIRVPRRKSASPRWLAENDEKNIREMHGTNVHLGGRGKRTKILSRANGSFDREAGAFPKNKRMLRINGVISNERISIDLY